MIPRPLPITQEEREFVAEVEGRAPRAVLETVAGEFAPSGLSPAELLQRMDAAEPGDRLRTAVEANMNASRHFDPIPVPARSAAAEQASLTAARVIDSSITVESEGSTGRLSALAGKGMDLLLRGQYREAAQGAAREAATVLSGTLNWWHLQQMQEAQRHAGAVAPASAAPVAKPTAAASTKSPSRGTDNNRDLGARD